MKNILLYLFALVLFAATAKAQTAKGSLSIQLNKSVLQPGDSLHVALAYTAADSSSGIGSLATVELVIENEQGFRSRLRWPLIDGKASGAIYLPELLSHGRYTLTAGLQNRAFEVVGKVQNPKNNRTIQAMLLTKRGDWDEQQVSVAPDGTFAIRNWLFEDNALMAFSPSGKGRALLDIRISTQLDSTYEPLAVGGRAFYVGTPAPAIVAALDEPLPTSAQVFNDGGDVLPAVIVRTVAKSRAQQFNEEHVSGLFRSGDERVLNIMDDVSAIGAPNIFSYLQGRIAGLQISPAGAARWRGGRVTFFLDEVRTSADQLASIPMSDIAIVKAYPAPFLGAPGGGGAIAIYTRRGGEGRYLPENKQVFKVRGYTPSSTVINNNKVGF